MYDIIGLIGRDFRSLRRERKPIENGGRGCTICRSLKRVPGCCLAAPHRRQEKLTALPYYRYSTTREKKFLNKSLEYEICIEKEAIFATDISKKLTMEQKKLSIETCTREQFIEVVRAAKERKKEWEKKMQQELESRELMRKQARESHYYDIEFA